MAIRSGIQLAYPFEERRLRNAGRFSLKWYPPYLVQPKLNGERCRIIISEDRCLLLSSSEDIISAVPHINHAGLSLPPGEYDGELYVHGLSWSEIHSIVSRESNLHSNHGVMELHLFDVVDENMTQSMRLARLNQLPLSQATFPIRTVLTEVAYTHEEVINLYDRFIKEGYEGFILRHIDCLYRRSRSAGMMKFKPKQTDHYRITGVFEAISEDSTPKGMVGGFNCIDDMSSRFSVGAGKLTHPERKELWERWLDSPSSLIGRMLEVEYQTLSDREKVPLFSRAVRII